MKACVVFEKGIKLRHIGHLDLMRTMQRALRRSDLPICYSQGFNPHILLSFAFPLSVGMVGRREIMEVPLSQTVSGQEFSEALTRALPADLKIAEVIMADDKHPSYMALLKAASYEIVFDDGSPFSREDIAGFLSAPVIMAVRKTKSGEKDVDIKPMIYAFDCRNGKLTAILASEESGTLKPDLLIRALADHCGMPVLPHYTVCRTQLWGQLSDGTFARLETI